MTEENNGNYHILNKEINKLQFFCRSDRSGVKELIVSNNVSLTILFNYTNCIVRAQFSRISNKKICTTRKTKTLFLPGNSLCVHYFHTTILFCFIRFLHVSLCNVSQPPSRVTSLKKYQSDSLDFTWFLYYKSYYMECFLHCIE